MGRPRCWWWSTPAPRGAGSEAEGFRGTAYLDARWVDPGPGQDLTGYALFDRSLHEAATVLRGRGMAVVVDDQPALFPEGAGLPAALYCGWYSVSRYVGAFAWPRGAVGYHTASGECVTLRRAGSQGWCKRLLEGEGPAVSAVPGEVTPLPLAPGSGLGGAVEDRGRAARLVSLRRPAS